MSNISGKLVKVMEYCGYVQKNGKNDFHKYRYASASDVLEKVNAALVKYGLACLAQSELIDLRDVVNGKGATEHLATIRVKLTVIDTDSGETIELCGLGSGQDPTDKAVMKAQTAAIKYAWMLSLNISTGDDPEADSGTDERAYVKETMDDLKTTPSNGCSDCGANITAGVFSVSTKKYGRPLCMKCQRNTQTVA